MAATPVLAQGNRPESSKFLEAIRDADGTVVTNFLDAPGQRIVNSRDRKTGETAVHILVRNGNTKFLRYVLAKGGDPDRRDDQDNTGALLAAEQGSIAAIDALSDYKASFNIPNKKGDLPLTVAVRLRRLDVIRKLIDVGADPDQPDTALGKSARDYAREDTRNPAILALLDETAPKVDRTKIAGPTLR